MRVVSSFHHCGHSLGMRAGAADGPRVTRSILTQGTSRLRFDPDGVEICYKPSREVTLHEPPEISLFRSVGGAPKLGTIYSCLSHDISLPHKSKAEDGLLQVEQIPLRSRKYATGDSFRPRRVPGPRDQVPVLWSDREQKWRAIQSERTTHVASSCRPGVDDENFPSVTYNRRRVTPDAALRTN